MTLFFFRARRLQGRRPPRTVRGPGCLILAAALLAMLLPGGIPAAVAAPTSCPQHYPGGVAPDITRASLAAETRELCFGGYAVLHSSVSRTPLAAAERLTRRRIQRAMEMERDDAFHAEDALPEDERSRLSDYARSGFDRGHMAPSGDMATAATQSESFSLANIVPQNPGMNRCLWEGIESTLREVALEEGDVWVLTGPIFAGNDLRRLNGRVLVPTSLYKAIYLPGRGEAGAYLAPNAPGLAWRAVSLDELRDVAGLDAFPSLPAAIKARAMQLPEPQPSNIRGSCENQPGYAGADQPPSRARTPESRAPEARAPQPRTPEARARTQAPAQQTAMTRRDLVLVVVSGAVFLIVVIIALRRR